jgi:hypothetical protein
MIAFFAELISNFESNSCAKTLKGYNFMLIAMFHFLSNMKKAHKLYSKMRRKVKSSQLFNLGFTSTDF